MHHRAGEINEAVAELEAALAKEGDLNHDDPDERQRGGNERGCSQGAGGATTSRGYGPDAPF